jgi:hypothetical protein
MIGQLRRSLAEQSGQNAGNATQVAASNQRNGHWGDDAEKDILGGEVEDEPVLDPMIYPGLYSPSGFDMMGILVSLCLSMSWFFSSESVCSS